MRSILGGKLYDLLWAFFHCPMDGPIMEAAHEIGPTFVELAQCGSHFHRTHIHPLTLLYVQERIFFFFLQSCSTNFRPPKVGLL